MNSCLHDDALLRIGYALDWEVEGGLRHLHDCARCRRTLEDLGELNRLLNGQETIDPEVTLRIMDALEREITAEAMVTESRPSTTTERWIRFLTSAIIAFVTVAVAAAMRGGGAAAIWTALFLALVAGAAATFVGEREQSSSGAAPV